MQRETRNGIVKGNVVVPSSKSVLQRYLLCSLLSTGKTTLHHVKHCNDTLACLSAIEALGAITSVSNNAVTIQGTGGNINLANGVINCGESGFAFRALASIASLPDKEIVLSGEGSLMNRPVSFVVDALKALHVNCSTKDGMLPLSVHGPLQFENVTLDGSLSSQFLSGLLLAAPLVKGDHTIEVVNLQSKKYVDLTVQVMNDFGVTVQQDSYHRFLIPGNQSYQPCVANMEGDWSAAAFILVAGAIGGEAGVKNLAMDSLQPDKEIIDVLQSCGAEVEADNNLVVVRRKELNPFSFDATDCPDLFPPLVALAVHCNGRSVIKGVERLIHKESNRALALQLEFSKLGVNITVEGNRSVVEGGVPLQSSTVDSHNDHRIAMALAIACIKLQGSTMITGSEAVKKSYPDFFNDLSAIIHHE